MAYSGIPASNVLVLAPEEGIYLTLRALLQPEDHVIVTYPGYQALYEVARSIGCTLSYWQPQLTQQHSWAFDVEQLEGQFRTNTKVTSSANSLTPASKAAVSRAR